MYGFILIVATSFPSIPRAVATLGEHESTVAKDRASIQMLHPKRAQVSSGARFHIHEITTDANTIREYASSDDGIVFAVTWRGLSEPDLSQLLGSKFETYKKGESQWTRGGRRIPSKIRSDDLVVEKSGHMRAVHGRAYVPSLVPAGVDLREIE